MRYFKVQVHALRPLLPPIHQLAQHMSTRANIEVEESCHLTDRRLDLLQELDGFTTHLRIKDGEPC